MARLGPGHSRKAGFPGGWAWEDSVGTGCGGADEYVSPLVVGCGGLSGSTCQHSDPFIGCVTLGKNHRLSVL